MLKLTISYEGTRFFGWQKTSSGPTIQEELERALAQITGGPVGCEAASRTDRGVHAKGQVVHCAVEGGDLARLKRGLNAVLPREIRVEGIEEMPPSFHATLDAAGKEYRYFLCNDSMQLPIHRLYSWHVPLPLDLEEMRQAAMLLMGTHDFLSLTNEETDDAIRTIDLILIVPLEGRRLSIEVKGKRFLYKMVRNLVGLLVAMGRGTMRKESILDLLAARDRRKAPMTAPARGLFLWNVYYDCPQ